MLFAFVLPWGCRDLNPAFKLNPDDPESIGASESGTSTDPQNPDANAITPSTKLDKPESEDSTASDTTTAPPLIPGTNDTSDQNILKKSPLCGDEFSLCFSMQANQDGNAVEEQKQSLAFTHSNTKLVSGEPGAKAPWDQLLKIPEYEDSAQTAAEFSIPKSGILGVEIAAKDLKCSTFWTHCPLIAIQAHVSINYNNEGYIECEARYQGNDAPGRIKIRVPTSTDAPSLRAVCWSDGSSLMFWANGSFKKIEGTGGLLPTIEPTQLVIGGQLNQNGYSPVKGSIALIRFWSDVENLKAKLDANPEL